MRINHRLGDRNLNSGLQVYYLNHSAVMAHIDMPRDDKLYFANISVLVTLGLNCLVDIICISCCLLVWISVCLHVCLPSVRPSVRSFVPPPIRVNFPPTERPSIRPSVSRYAVLILDSRFWEGKTHISGGEFDAFFNVFFVFWVFSGGNWDSVGNPPGDSLK